MRTRLALTPLALIATALLGSGLLAGCGQSSPAGDSPAADSPVPTPSFSVSTAAPDGTSPGGASSAPPASATQSAQPSPTDGPTAASTPAAPPSAGTSDAPDAGGTVHTYRNLTVRLPVGDDAVPDAPQGLTAYLNQALTDDWHRLGGSAGCKRGGMITVNATRSDGFAYVMRDIDPALQSCPKAASMAGGYRAVWKQVDGAWNEVLGMQDVPPCSDFEKWAVPSALLGQDAQCLQGDDVVPYHHS